MRELLFPTRLSHQNDIKKLILWPPKQESGPSQKTYITSPTNKSSLNDVILALGAWNVLKRPAPGLGKTAGLKKRVKISAWGSPRDQACTFSEGTPDHNCVKEKKAYSNRVKTYNSENFLKQQSHFLHLKEHLYKNVKGKKGLGKSCWSSPLKRMRINAKSV